MSLICPYQHSYSWLEGSWRASRASRARAHRARAHRASGASGTVRNANEEQTLLPVRVLNGARTVPARCPYGARTVRVLAVRVLNGARTFD